MYNSERNILTSTKPFIDKDGTFDVTFFKRIDGVSVAICQRRAVGVGTEAEAMAQAKAILSPSTIQFFRQNQDVPFQVSHSEKTEKKLYV